MADNSHELPKVDEALAYASAYLQSPSTIWLTAPIQTRLKLQRFQFPSGLVFNGEIFETAEVSCVFRLKIDISANQSTMVVIVRRSSDPDRASRTRRSARALPSPMLVFFGGGGF